MPLLNKILFIILFSAFTFAPVIAEPETIQVTREIVNEKGEQMELIQNEVNVKDLDIDPINTKKVKQSVVPDTKKESKKIMMLFLKTMAAVAFCTVIIYIILLFVKKFYSSAFVNQEVDEYENLDLATPNTKEEALKNFLNRVK